MVLEMKVPSPGESITEVEIATWLVKDGDYVKKEPLSLTAPLPETFAKLVENIPLTSS